ncbi:MAG: acyltransferase family protein [Nevskiales bacterium]
MSKNNLEEFTALNALRAMGAFCVVYFHVYVYFYSLGLPQTWVLPMFHTWIEFFIILGGFVITHAYAEKFKANPLPTYRDFAVARFARVYPLHVVVLAAMVLMELGRLVMAWNGLPTVLPNAPFTRMTDPEYLPANLLLVQAWGMMPHNTWNVPAWTVSADVFCYALFPVLILWGLVNRSAWVTIAVALGSFALLEVLKSRKGILDYTYNFGILRCFPSFVIGCILYGAPRKWMQSCGPWMREFVPVASLSVVVLGFWLGADDMAMICAMIFMVLGFAENRSRVVRWFSVKPLRYLGDLSYSIYLVHQPMIIAIVLWLVSSEDAVAGYLKASPYLLVGATYVLIVVVSHYTYRHVELPAQRWLKKRWGGKSTPVVALALEPKAP